MNRLTVRSQSDNINIMSNIDPETLVTNKKLDEAVDAILKGMDNMINNFKSEVKNRFDKVDDRFDKIDADISFVKDDIKGLTAELSGNVSGKDFEKLKSKVDKYITS